MQGQNAEGPFLTTLKNWKGERKMENKLKGKNSLNMF